jgi:hypothetical protein
MNKITFRAINKNDYDTFLKPVPASTLLPSWWREETPYTISPDNPDGKKITLYQRQANTTFKKCTPMLDSLTSGYIIQLWSDVLVRQINGEPEITWRTQRSIFELHGNNGKPFKDIVTPKGYSNTVFKYLNTWIPITPSGYSIFVGPAVGYNDSPFRAVPAIIDTDKSTLEFAPPMWIKEGFEGVIEKGTPLVQITPFKRENWKSETTFYEDLEFEKVQERNFNSTIVNHYIKNVWTKKTYK